MKVYDSSGKLKLSSIRAGSSNPIAITGTARALVVQNNAANPNSAIDVTADEVVLRDSGSGLYLIATTVAVTVNLAGTVGTPGALDTGVEAADTWYYVWLVSNGSTVAALFSTSTTAPMLPSGYTYKARVGAVRNDASSNLVRTYQVDRQASIPSTTISNTSPGVAATYVVFSGAVLVAFQATVPPTATWCRGTMGGNGTVAAVIAISACSNTGTVDAAAPGENMLFSSAGTGAQLGWGVCGHFEVPVRGHNLQWKSNNAGTVQRIDVSGFTLP